MEASNIRVLSPLLATMLGLAAVFPGTCIAAPALHSSFDLHVPVAPAPLTVAGMPQLVYELHLRNFSDEALTLHGVKVLDAERGTVLAELRDAALERQLGRATDGAEPRVLGPGTHAVVYFELALRSSTVPQALRHRMEYTGMRQAPERRMEVEGARVAVDTTPPLVLGPPLRGGPWAAIHAPSWKRGHRRVAYAINGRARLPGRYAIDWIRLDAGGHTARGDGDRVDHWYGYGEEVLAVADATVVATRDDVAESASVSGHGKSALADATGNYVALDLGHGRHAFYEHLRPGSIRVHLGQRGRRGQVSAALGFTGDSTGPHLHFHVADANSPLGAEGMPFVLQRFDVLGGYDTALTGFGKQPWQPNDAGFAPHRHAERPAPNTVIMFPEE